MHLLKFPINGYLMARYEMYVYHIFFFLLEFMPLYSTNCVARSFEQNHSEFLECKLTEYYYCEHPISSGNIIFSDNTPIDDIYITIGNGNRIFYPCASEKVVLYPLNENPNNALIETEHYTDNTTNIGIPNKVFFKFTRRALDDPNDIQSLRLLESRYIAYIENQQSIIQNRINELNEFYNRANLMLQQNKNSGEIAREYNKIINGNGTYSMVGQSALPESWKNDLNGWHDKLNGIKETISNLKSLKYSYYNARDIIGNNCEDFAYFGTPINKKLLEMENFHNLYPKNVKVTEATKGTCNRGLLREYTVIKNNTVSLCIGESVEGVPITAYNTYETRSMRPVITFLDLARRKAYRIPYCFTEGAIDLAEDYLIFGDPFANRAVDRTWSNLFSTIFMSSGIIIDSMNELKNCLSGTSHISSTGEIIQKRALNLLTSFVTLPIKRWIRRLSVRWLEHLYSSYASPLIQRATSAVKNIAKKAFIPLSLVSIHQISPMMASEYNQTTAPAIAY